MAAVLKPIELLRQNIGKLEAFRDESLWPVVEKTWADGWKCGECPNFKSWTEPHGERMSECRLIENGGNPVECLGAEE